MVLHERSGVAPSVAGSARVAPSAQLVGDVRVGDGCVIAHVGARLAPGSRVGMRQYAVAGDNGEAVVMSDLDEARELLATADFFGRMFGEDEADLEARHRSTVATLRREAGT